jgi:hypothetical protein
MSIKGDVVDHLLAHRGEVVSLTALASKLDTSLDTVRNAISTLRSERQYGGGMREHIKVISKGYAVKYVGPPRDVVAPAEVETPVVAPKPGPPPSASKPVVDVMAPATAVNGHVLPEDLLDRFAVGPIARRVLACVVAQNGEEITSDEIIAATGLNKPQVYGALYNTLTSTKQRNPEAMLYFEKTKHGVYRFRPNGDATPSVVSGLIGRGNNSSKTEQRKAAAGDPVVARTVEKLYGDKATGLSTRKQLFEEIRTLPDGAILIEDEDGRVYKATEV